MGDIATAQLDRNIRALVRELNRFDGLETIGSCGGHEHPTPAQARIGRWWVTFGIDREGDDGWFALEFLSWLINHDGAMAGGRPRILTDAYPPHLNMPGQSLRFEIQGNEDDPEALAMRIAKARNELYVSPAELAAELETEMLTADA
jgi:hypothetical protein